MLHFHSLLAVVFAALAVLSLSTDGAHAAATPSMVKKRSPSALAPRATAAAIAVEVHRAQVNAIPHGIDLKLNLIGNLLQKLKDILEGQLSGAQSVSAVVIEVRAPQPALTPSTHPPRPSLPFATPRLTLATTSKRSQKRQSPCRPTPGSLASSRKASSTSTRPKSPSTPARRSPRARSPASPSPTSPA